MESSLDSSRWNQIQEIFGRACNLEPVQRAAFLRSACDGDDELRRDIEELLDADSADHEFLDASPQELLDEIELQSVPGLAASPAPVLPLLQPRDVLAGRYEIESYIASGGMGQVYRAHDFDLGVSLALKTIRPDVSSDPASLRAFKREVLLARSVTHPNVCRIFDLGHDQATGLSFLTMEFLPGENPGRSNRNQRRHGLPAKSLPLIRQMASALDAAHRAGIVHRDFKSRKRHLGPKRRGGPRGDHRLRTRRYGRKRAP